MMSSTAMVFVIDDDQSMRKSLERLLDAACYKVELFKSASEFLSRLAHAGPSFVIVDVPKPFKPRQLLESVERGLARSAEQHRRASEKNHAGGLLERLTPREYQVMQLVATGMLNKQVGGELGMAEKTVKTHRAHVMQKLGITSVAELMLVLQKAEVPPIVRPGTKV